MSAYREPTPSDQPYKGAHKVLKEELIQSLNDFIYLFEHEDSNKSAMSRLLRLHQTIILSHAKDIGGSIYRHAQEFFEACANYANGQGKIESIYEHLILLKKDLTRL